MKVAFDFIRGNYLSSSGEGRRFLKRMICSSVHIIFSGNFRLHFFNRFFLFLPDISIKFRKPFPPRFNVQIFISILPLTPPELGISDEHPRKPAKGAVPPPERIFLWAISTSVRAAVYLTLASSRQAVYTCVRNA